MTQARDELRAAAAAVRRRAGLARQLEQVRADLGGAEARLAEATQRLHAEAKDVARLEGLSLTRMWAVLRGSELDDLQRERAEQQVAAYAAAAAQQVVDETRARLAALEGRIDALGDPDDLIARQATATRARADELRAHPDSAALLDDIAARQGALTAETAELQEAQAAAVRADAALANAQRCLADASGWATYDTFFGGGMIADLAKHGKMDEAAALLRTADSALTALAAELADVGIEAIGDLRVDALSRTFDIWFDNIFSDWSVRERIVSAGDRVRQLSDALAQLSASLSARALDLARADERLRAEQLAALGGADTAR